MTDCFTQRAARLVVAVQEIRDTLFGHIIGMTVAAIDDAELPDLPEELPEAIADALADAAVELEYANGDEMPAAVSRAVSSVVQTWAAMQNRPN